MKNKWSLGALYACRLLMACTFVFSGLVKLIDPRGTQYKIEDYTAAFGCASWLPDGLPLLLAVLLALVEFCIGACLLFGIRRRATACFALLFMLVMTPLALYLALANPVTNCGCFGDAWVLTNWQTFGKNAFLLAAAIALALHPRSLVRFISEGNQWVISLYSLVFGIALALYSIYRLPPVDFRPYSVGTDLPKEIEAEWMGERPTMHYADFCILNDAGDDITLDWLSQPGYSFLLVAPYLERADDGSMERINALSDYCVEHGYPFLCLTSSGDDAILQWSDMTGAEYPFAMTDGIALKTVVRSNPGLVMLRDGVIQRKWATGALPEIDDASLPADQQEALLPAAASKGRVWAYLSLWYLLPLMFFSIVDTAYRKRKRSKDETQ